MTGLKAALAECPVIAILRAQSAARFGEVADTLRVAGVRAVEFTLSTPRAVDALREYAAAAPGDLALGAGTVISPEAARSAVEAGASYLICPATCLDVVEEARALGVPVIPGAYTPSEILTAWRAGAAMVKLFPAATGGPEYLRAIRAPLPDIPLIPTGGITLTEAPAYLSAGAAAVGLGNPLIGDACDGGDLAALRGRATTLIERLRS